MESKVCVNCSNKKAVNETDNRLVTENCGHVKCMQCLLQEVTGCIACQKVEKQSKEDTSKEPVLNVSKVEPDRKRAKLERKGCVDDAEDNLESLTQSDSLAVEETALEKQSSDYEIEKRRMKPSTEHIITAKDGKTECYLCTLCRRKFSARSQVTYHAYCNGEKKPFECRECKKRFATRSHYNYHMQSKHPTTCRGRYICEICDASFIQKSKLQRHKLVIHTKEKKYACKECGKAFNNACSLRKHGLLHSGEKPYMCPHCPRFFRDSSNLKKHINNKHTTSGKSRSLASQTQSNESEGSTEVVLRLNGRKHQCGRCPKAFHSGKDLRRHQKVHEDEKPFACQIRDLKCKQPRFRRLDNYNRHLRNTHGLVEPRPAVNGQNGVTAATVVEKDEVREKAKLEVLNPLPPLPADVIQKHLYTEEETGEERTKDSENQPTTDNTEPAIDKILVRSEVINKKSEDQAIGKNNEKAAIDKSRIIEANTARQSVIVGTTIVERKAPSPVPAYVHKIRKANSLSGQKVCLPPIDTRKLVELAILYPHSKEEPPPPPLDSAPLRVKNVETLKSILHDDADTDKHDAPTMPTVHWRKKRLTDNE